MKRLLALLAIAALLLAGCSNETPDASGDAQNPTDSTDVTGPAPDSSRIHDETGGVLDAYVLPTQDYTGIREYGSNILLFSQSAESTALTLISKETAAIVHTLDLGCTIDPDSGDLQLGSNRLAYYNRNTCQLVFLDSTLRQTGQVELPENIQGSLVMSEDLDRIYYCTDAEIRVLDLQSGISRLLKQHSVTAQSLTALCFEESLLVCALTDADGNDKTLYISTTNGATVYTEEGHTIFTAYENVYFAPRTNGTVQELLFGLRGEATQNLTTLSGSAQPVLSISGAVAFPEADGRFGMDFYDLETGRRTASVMLPSMVFPAQLLGEAGTDVLWFLAHDQQDQQNVLCRWDLTKGTVEDDTSYTSLRYTADNPDEAGLAQAKAQAQQIGEIYGVEICIWQDALVDCGYTLKGEFQVSAILRQLTTLQEAMAKFPDGFFQNLANGTQSSRLRICLVRSITGSIGELTGLQTWVGGESYIILTVSNSTEQSFYHQLSHAIDSRVIVETKFYDDWNSLNPEGFQYGSLGENPSLDYFIDDDCLTSAADDRATIFAYAMLDNADYVFEPDTIQAKLLRICEAIRKTFALKDSPEVFPWEQYLDNILAAPIPEE